MAKSTDHPQPIRIVDETLAYEFDITTDLGRLPLAIRWGGQEVLEIARPIETPSFVFAMLKFCRQGRGVYESDTERFEVTAGDLIWSAPHQATTLTTSRDEPMTNFAVAMMGSDCRGEFERCLHVPVGVLKLREPALISAVFELIMQEGRGNGDHREEIATLLATILLRRIDAQSKTPLETHALARQTFKRCRDYIEQNFANIASLRIVAQACDVTVPYLCRLFDQFFDCGPYEYMTRLKMNRAESLLLRPSMPISEVATAVGYKDPRLFARNFKVAFGKTPTKYRSALMPPVEK